MLNPDWRELPDEEDEEALRREVREVERVLHALVGERLHRRRCGCPACCYARYERAPHGKGRLISKRMFFIYVLRKTCDGGCDRGFPRRIIKLFAGRPRPPAVGAFLADLLRSGNINVCELRAGREAEDKCEAILANYPPA